MTTRQHTRESRTRGQATKCCHSGREGREDNDIKNKLESAHQFGVFAGIVPRTGELVVLIVEGVVAARTVHRLSEDQKWDTEFMSRVK